MTDKAAAGDTIRQALRGFPHWADCDGGRLVIACSGGLDSVVLAHAAIATLASLTELGKWRNAAPEIILWHLRHGIRDDDAADAGFVATLAGQWGLRCVTESADVPAQRRPGTDSIESAARRVRYARLLSFLRQADASIAFTAHHADDNAESILFNLVRGTGPAGLRGINPRFMELIHRPLLSVTQQDIRDYAQTHQLSWHEDSSNSDTTFSRNFIRHEIMPRLRQINPAAAQHINRLADMARAGLGVEQEGCTLISSDLLARELPLMQKPTRDFGLVQFEFEDMDELQQKATISGALKAIGSRVDNAAIAGVSSGLMGEQDFYDAGDRHYRFPEANLMYWESLSAEAAAQADAELRVSQFPTTYTEAQREQLLNGMNLPAQRYPVWPSWLAGFVEPHPGRAWNVLLPRRDGSHYQFRRRRDGDRLRLPGGGSRKLGDVFTDMKIPGFLREHWAVLVDDNDEPVWLPGLADSARMHEVSSSGDYWYIVLWPLK